MSGLTRTPEDLMADIQRCLSLSVADSTKQTYSTGEKVLSSSSPSIDMPLHAQSLPTDEDTLIQYVAYLAKSVKHSTIKGYFLRLECVAFPPLPLLIFFGFGCFVSLAIVEILEVNVSENIGHTTNEQT